MSSKLVTVVLFIISFIGLRQNTVDAQRTELLDFSLDVSGASQKNDGMTLIGTIPYDNLSEGAKWVIPTYIPNGNILFTVKKKGGDWIRVVWDPKDRKVLSIIDLSDFKNLKSLDIVGLNYVSRDGKYLATGKTYKTGGVLVQDLKSNSILLNTDGKYKMGRTTGVWITKDTSDNSVFVNFLYPDDPTKEKYKNFLEVRNIHTNQVTSKKEITYLENLYVYGWKHIALNTHGKSMMAVGLVNQIVISSPGEENIRIDLYGTDAGQVWTFGNDFYFSPYGNYLIVSSSKQKPLRRNFRIYRTSNGEQVFEFEAPDKKSTPLISVESSLEMLTASNDERLIYLYEMPELLKEEVRHANWLKSCTKKQDSLAAVAAKTTPLYKIKSPNNDWIYLGEEGVDGFANGIGDAIRHDGIRFIKNGLFIEGNFVAGKMENVYEVSMQGEFKNMKLNGFGKHITENKAILEGTFLDGKLEGQGASIDPSGLTYIGEFKEGAFDGKGKITRPDGETYDGEFVSGKPHGAGIYINGNVIEECRYFNGKRIDQAYQLKLQADRIERERKLAELQAQKRQEYLAAQQNKKSSNKLFGALAMGVGFGALGSSVGMDAMQAVEFGGAMYQDVMSGGTANLQQFESNMMAGFEAKKVQYDQVDPTYTQKAQENKCNLTEIYDGPDGGQGGAYCAQATLMKCHGKMDRVAQLCKLYKQVTNEPCAVCN